MRRHYDRRKKLYKLKVEIKQKTLVALKNNKYPMPHDLKYTQWADCYYDLQRRHPKTRGNATQAAITAYGYDSTEQYTTAAVQGSRNVNKAKAYVFSILELNGISSGNIIFMLLLKALEGSYRDWGDFMKFIGYI